MPNKSILENLVNIKRYLELCYSLDIGNFEKDEIAYILGITCSIIDDIDTNDNLFRDLILNLEENIFYITEFIECVAKDSSNRNYKQLLKYLDNINTIICYLKIDVFVKI